MGYNETLDEEFKQHLASVAAEQEFEVYQEYASNTGGALMKLKNQQLRIELINNRGIVNLNISPMTGKERFKDAELISSYLNLLKSKNDELTKWARKKIVNQRIGLSDQINLLTDHANDLCQIFSKKQLKMTLKELDKLGEERFNNMF